MTNFSSIKRLAIIGAMVVPSGPAMPISPPRYFSAPAYCPPPFYFVG